MLLSSCILRLGFSKRILQCARFNSTEQVEYLKTALSNGRLDWTDVKKNILEKRGNCNTKNIDAMMLKVMVNNKYFDAALKFADYLKKDNTDLSLGAINGLLILYYNYSKHSNLAPEEREFILNTYNKLYEKYKILDYTTGDNLIHALCAIDEWKKCKRILEDVKISGTPTHSAYSTIIGTLFRLNKKADAMKMIDVSVNDRRPLQDYAYEEWIKSISRKYKDKKTILKYLEEICLHIENSAGPIPKVTADRLKDAFSSLQFETKNTEIVKKTGDCITCWQTLDCHKLTDEEFLYLQNNVKEKLIVGSDLFLKSSPEELERFQKFVQQTAPYDIVIDALNLLYLAQKNVKDRMHILNYVVNYFSTKNMRILVLGRKHMFKLNKGSLHYMMRRAFTFFTDDLSQDDPYFITAAILSGSHTDILSRDLLRGHRFTLRDDNLRRIFLRWQWQHQWKAFNSKRGPFVLTPLPYTPCAQKNSGVWHIPYESEENLDDGKINDGVPDCSTWLCLRPKPDSS
ncbi:unnamed protein product [Leptosia nina]|uniref:Mitochondrial ribonuclease P catalytic subunit n=1 Tax=Leptosia nina TaxID=320188 RepID=A0AAV1J1V7_9NEOP